MKLPKFKKIKVENDRLEELKREFKKWKKKQRQYDIKHDEDKLDWYCYLFLILIFFIPLIVLFLSLGWF